MGKYILSVAQALLWLGLLSCEAQAQELVTDFKSAPANGAYSFASTTPKSLPELLKPGAAANAEAVNIVGHLFLPEGKGTFPVVVLMHGSGGIYSAMLDYWPKLLNAQGIGVFSLDTFGPRGVKSTAEDQSQVPFAADVADVFSALRLLATHPHIDAKRIAIMGFSRGGITAWRTAVDRIAAVQQTDGLRFAAHIQTYAGGCSGIFRLIVKPGVFDKTPQLWLHGDSDDYTPIAPCQDYAKQIADAGTPVEFVTLPGAWHKFDGDDQRHLVLRGAQKTLATCPIEMDINTLYYYDHGTGQRLSGEALQQVQKSCSALGASVEGNKATRDKAGEAAVVFLKKVFGL